MENSRLYRAIFLSLLVIAVYTIWIAEPPPKPEPGSQGSAQPGVQPGTAGSGLEGPLGSGLDTAASAPAKDFEPTSGVLRAETEERLTIDFGEPGGAGHWEAVFTNRGALLEGLKFGDYFVRTGLDEAGRADRENWLALLAGADTGGAAQGSLGLRANVSAKSLVNPEEPLDKALWVMEPVFGDAYGFDRPAGVMFRYAPGTGVVFEKLITHVPGTWHLAVELTLVNENAGPAGPRQFVLTPASVVPAELGDQFYVEPTAVAAGPRRRLSGDEYDEVELDDVKKSASSNDWRGELTVPGPLAFAGAHNKYFAALLRGRTDVDAATMISAGYRRLPDAKRARAEALPLSETLDFVVADVDLALQLPPEGQSTTWIYELYAGPKETAPFLGDFVLGDQEPHGLIVDEDLNWFAGIGRLLLLVMGFFHGLIGNWGWSIILLTVCVRGILFPLNRRSQTAMARYQKKMKRVQPKLDALKVEYKDDLQKQRQEQARIMQEEKAFPPLGGCLPIFVQMPVFFGLFSALRTSPDLRQAPFMGWITDLSQPDRMFPLGFEIPILGTSYFNLLPPLMVVLWILQQKGMPQPADEQARRMQKMMMFMPVVMGVFLYNYAAGLSLYMITQSGLGIFEQHFIKKKWPVSDIEVEKPKKGCGPFSGMMQNLAEKQQEQMKRMQQAQRQNQSSKQRSGKKRKQKR